MPTQRTERKAISVEIQLTSGDFPTDDELGLRWALEDQIEERGIGHHQGGGAGGGRMDFSFEVSGANLLATAMEQVRQLLREFDVLERATLTVHDVYEQICDPTPDFRPGDCLSFRFEDGDYGAVIVLARGDAGLMGPVELLTLVGLLDYKAPRPPTLSQFEERNWLIATQEWRRGERYLVWLHCFGGIQVAVAGRISVSTEELITCVYFHSWDGLPECFMHNQLT